MQGKNEWRYKLRKLLMGPGGSLGFQEAVEQMGLIGLSVRVCSIQEPSPDIDGVSSQNWKLENPTQVSKEAMPELY